MPEPIPVLMDYQVERIHHRPTLDNWHVGKDFQDALFLCRITRQGGLIIDSIPVAMFSRDSEAGRFSLEFLKKGVV